MEDSGSIGRPVCPDSYGTCLSLEIRVLVNFHGKASPMRPQGLYQEELTSLLLNFLTLIIHYTKASYV